MSARRGAAALITVAAIGVGAATCSAPAHSDIPSNVSTGRHGVVDAGWVRVACAVSGTGARCSLRFPEGVRRTELTYILGGDLVGIETLWDHDTPGRTRGRVRRMAGRVAPGVRVKCSTFGATATCTVGLARRYKDFNVTIYSAGVGLGGLRADGLVL